MYSLIIALMAILLVVLLVVATLYFGGDAVVSASTKASASAVINQASQIVAAGVLVEGQGEHWPEGAPNFPDYILNMPTPPASAYMPDTVPQVSDWVYYTQTSNAFILENKINKKVCMEINRQQGFIGIPMALTDSAVAQCFGVSEPYSFYRGPTGMMPPQVEDAVSKSITRGTTLLSQAPVQTVTADVTPPGTSTARNYATAGYPVLCPSGNILSTGVCLGGLLDSGTATPTPPAPKTYTISDRPGMVTTDGKSVNGNSSFLTVCSDDLPVGSISTASVLELAGASIHPAGLWVEEGAQCMPIVGIPAHAAGVVPMTLTNVDGTIAKGTLTYVESFNAAPAVAAVSPIIGSDLVKTEVTITGSGFVNGSVGYLARSVLPTTFIDSQTLKVVMPTAATVGIFSSPGSFGATTVRVANPGSATSTNSVSYRFSTVPSLSNVINTNPKAGDAMELYGFGIPPATELTLNGVKVPSTSNDTATRLAFTMPSLPAGKYYPSVKVPGYALVTGSQAILVSGDPSVSPSTVSSAGGTVVTIKGTPLVEGVYVIAAQQRVPTTIIDDMTLSFEVPPSEPGTYEIVIVFPSSPAIKPSTPLTVE